MMKREIVEREEKIERERFIRYELEYEELAEKLGIKEEITHVFSMYGNPHKLIIDCNKK